MVRISLGNICIGDPSDHGVNGIGNQLYAIANNAVLARRYNANLAIGRPLVRATFDSAHALRRSCTSGREWPAGTSQRGDRSLKKGRRGYQSLKHNVTTRLWYWERAVNQPLRPAAMYELFVSRYQPWVWKEVRRIQAVVSKIHTVIHLRTWSEMHCAKKLTTGSCGQRLPTRALRCIHNRVEGASALLFTDYDGGEMRTLLNRYSIGAQSNGTVYYTEPELFPVGLEIRGVSLSIKKKHSIASVLWVLAYEAPLFIGSSSSSLSKSIAMARLNHQRSILVNMRCRRAKGDGNLFACRNATLGDLV